MVYQFMTPLITGEKAAVSSVGKHNCGGWGTTLYYPGVNDIDVENPWVSRSKNDLHMMAFHGFSTSILVSRRVPPKKDSKVKHRYFGCLILTFLAFSGGCYTAYESRVFGCTCKTAVTNGNKQVRCTLYISVEPGTSGRQGVNK